MSTTFGQIVVDHDLGRRSAGRDGTTELRAAALPVHCLRVLVVSDRDRWSDRAAQIAADLDAVAERQRWATAGRATRPPASMVVDVQPPFSPRKTSLTKWARWGWQPVCLVSLATEPGAARFADLLYAVGYRSVLLDSARGSYWRRLASTMQEILQRRAVLVALVAKALRSGEPCVVEALSVAWHLLPRRRTVEDWAAALGMARRQQLEVSFAKRGLPFPKKVLEWLQLLQVVDFARRSAESPTRDALAYRFNYPSGDYLGRRAKYLTGESFGRLVAEDIEQVLARMSLHCDMSR